MDVTTAVRFHPIELILSFVFKSLVILCLGAPEFAVAVFALLLFVGPAFNHSNIFLPTRVDRLLRYIIATPDTHRTHHSINKAEQDMNYGFFLIWWDKLFGTYKQAPEKGHDEMKLGVAGSPAADQVRLDQMLLAPFYKVL